MKADDDVVIVGTEGLSLMSTHIWQKAGTTDKIITTDIDDKKLEVAKKKCRYPVNSKYEDPVRAVIS